MILSSEIFKEYMEVKPLAELALNIFKLQQGNSFLKEALLTCSFRMCCVLTFTVLWSLTMAALKIGTFCGSEPKHFFLSMHYLVRVFYFLYWAHISDINAQLKLEIKWKKLKHDFMIFKGFLVTLLTKIELIAFKVGWDYCPKKSVKLSQPE